MENSEQQKKEKVSKPKGPGIGSKLKAKLSNYKRVVDIARKPEKDEFISTAKITGMGMALLGAIGFIIFLLYFLVRVL
ncbi:MAG: protein translocase SEC61 complex subunit gamma [Candidatus Aenigmarchaeota archaeon]|nr:protein translocase SEC61 complex subunit gamma [Candidatus Aenigmarchaeota archaeon]